MPLPAPPDPALPLQGVTVLAVEDSRYACEALRLMAQRLGARLRRAEALADARRHLALYRPDVVLVDLGLPDGDGTALIREVAVRPSGAPVVLGMSGDPAGRRAALAAGAAGFLDKPVAGLRPFAELLARHLGRLAPGEAASLPAPDALALRDDLARAARLLEGDGAGRGRLYLAGFLAGLARSAEDDALAEAARRLSADPGAAPAVAALVAERLRGAPGAFARAPGG